MAGNLIAAVATYIALLAVIFNRTLVLPAEILALVALPLLLILSYQMTLAASIIRRSDSAKALENELFRESGLDDSVRDKIGTAQSDQVMDIRTLTDPKVRPARWLPKFIVAALPYVGWYVIGIALTGYLATDVHSTLDSDFGASGWPGWVRSLFALGLTGYVVLWALFALAGFYYFFPGVVNWAKTVGRNTRAALPEADNAPRFHAAGAAAKSTPESQVAALAQLHWSDIQGNLGSSTLSITLVGTTAAYVTILATSYRSEVIVPMWLYCLLVLPILLMQSYQMILTAAVMRRADSAERIEKVLAARAGLQKQSRPLIGTATSDSVMNVFNVRKQLEPGEGRIVNAARGAVASMPFAGWYITGFLLTGYTMWSAWQLYMYDEGGAFRGWSAVWIGALVLYAGFWLSFVLATGEYFLGWFSPASARSRRKLKKLRRRKKARASPNPERG